VPADRGVGAARKADGKIVGRRGVREVKVLRRAVLVRVEGDRNHADEELGAHLLEEALKGVSLVATDRLATALKPLVQRKHCMLKDWRVD